MSLIALLNYFDQKAGREQYGNLLNEYRVAPDPEARPLGNTREELDQNIARMQGGFRGDGGVLSGGPPQDFYLRAAALPGYQQLAQQALVGQQAMERQTQEQIWNSNNMTLAQKTAADAQAQQQQWREYEFRNLSAAQEAQNKLQQQQVGISGGHLALARDEFNAKYMPDPNNPKGFVPRPVRQQAPSGYQWAPDGTLVAIPGGPATKPTAEQDRAMAGLQTMLPSLELINQGKGNMGYTEAALASIPGVGPTLAKWSQSGPEGAQRAAEGVFAANYIHAMSGTAASEAEVKRLTDSIFARPGDSQAALRQKQANREAIARGQNIIAGNKEASWSQGAKSKEVTYNPKTGRLE